MTTRHGSPRRHDRTAASEGKANGETGSGRVRAWREAVSPGLVVAGATLNAATWLSGKAVDALARPLQRHGIRRASWWAVELYVVAALILSIAIWLFAPPGTPIGFALVGILFMRQLDMVATQLRIVLIDTGTPGWGLLNVRRSLLLGLLNLLQVILVFAAADRILATHSFCSDSCGQSPESALGFLYLSWTTITLGSGYRPIDAVGKSLVMAEVTCAVITLVILVGWLVSGIRLKELD